MLKGQVNPPGWFQVCPRCKSVVDYTCSCPELMCWGAPATPPDVELLHFGNLDDAKAATVTLRGLTAENSEPQTGASRGR